MSKASIITPAVREYQGVMTNPDRWALFEPRKGDVLVCTPAKCGTTWTQAIIAHLLSGGADLKGPIPVISPWVDAELGAGDDVRQALEAQKGRRVVKTHTPADGFPVWDGVHVVAVYRHPLDVFLSLRKHGMNMKQNPDHPMNRPISEAFADFLSLEMADDDIDRDSLDLIATHFDRTVASKRLPNLTVLHYADMIADHAGSVRKLAGDLSVNASDALIDKVVTATQFGAMKAQARDYVPEGGKGFWHKDSAFFDSGGTNKWKGVLGEDDLARYAQRMTELVPDPALRHWLEYGGLTPLA